MPHSLFSIISLMSVSSVSDLSALDYLKTRKIGFGDRDTSATKFFHNRSWYMPAASESLPLPLKNAVSEFTFLSVATCVSGIDTKSANGVSSSRTPSIIFLNPLWT